MYDVEPIEYVGVLHDLEERALGKKCLEYVDKFKDVTDVASEAFPREGKFVCVNGEIVLDEKSLYKKSYIYISVSLNNILASLTLYNMKKSNKKFSYTKNIEVLSDEVSIGSAVIALLNEEIGEL